MTSPQQLPQESLQVIKDKKHNNSQFTGEFGGNSEFHPMSLASVEQSSSEGDASNGMTIAPQQQRKSKLTFPTLGFRLVWNDAPNAAQQDAKGTYAKYEKVKTLGKGAFGTAVLLRHRRTGSLVVSKQVRVQEMLSREPRSHGYSLGARRSPKSVASYMSVWSVSSRYHYRRESSSSSRGGARTAPRRALTFCVVRAGKWGNLRARALAPLGPPRADEDNSRLCGYLRDLDRTLT